MTKTDPLQPLQMWTRRPPTLISAPPAASNRLICSDSTATSAWGMSDEPHNRLVLPLVPRGPRPGAERRATSLGSGRVSRRAGRRAAAVPDVQEAQGVGAGGHWAGRRRL